MRKLELTHNLDPKTLLDQPQHNLLKPSSQQMISNIQTGQQSGKREANQSATQKKTTLKENPSTKPANKAIMKQRNIKPPVVHALEEESFFPFNEEGQGKEPLSDAYEKDNGNYASLDDLSEEHDKPRARVKMVSSSKKM